LELAVRTPSAPHTDHSRLTTFIVLGYCTALNMYKAWRGWGGPIRLPRITPPLWAPFPTQTDPPPLVGKPQYTSR
jgi:hypothetical protein